MLKAGMRANNLPGPEESVVLMEHIVTNFGGNRVEEIRLAFEMAFAWKLDLDVNDIKTFENFSCAYFSQIMNSYRMWAAEAIKQLKTVDKPLEQKIFTQAELDNSAREDAEIQYQRFLKGYDVIAPELNHPILSKDKLIKDGEHVRHFFRRMASEGKQNIYVRK